MFNLFRNRLVNEAVEKEVKAYVKQQEQYRPKLQESYDKSTGFAALVYEIEKLLCGRSGPGASTKFTLLTRLRLI